MDSRNGLIPFGLLIVLFAFTFVFCIDSLSIPNMTYLTLAIIGYVVCIAASLLLGLFARQEGGALSVYYSLYALLVSIIFVWYLTRVGTFVRLWS
jgi:hypothetical protein